ncbi:MAG: PIN domain-containing protein [Candidatus Woesearchaeota archaeon]
MRLIIDTNEIISALIKNSISRKIILNNNFNFYSPDFVKFEIYKHKNLILKKSNLTELEFNEVISILFDNITVIDISVYFNYLNKAKLEINDENDLPFLALALSGNYDGIWTNDKDFDGVKSIRVYSTKDLIKFL